jgi:hypothetical protein
LGWVFVVTPEGLGVTARVGIACAGLAWAGVAWAGPV